MDLFDKAHSGSYLKMYLIIFMLFALIMSSNGRTRSLNYRSIKACRGLINIKCKYLTRYCRTRSLFKRDIGNKQESSEEFSEEDKNHTKRSPAGFIIKRVRFRVTCDLCRKFCW
ncbi:uncharacterized protein LOC143465521 isoform X2 [Clavelina lepadiformis]|uniref:uncharacterized protein LOC143465521 isoform X2 n=1 Tax=Clavelina lepadiformis TaxID=159417 RepID=UPI0040433C42